MLVLSFASADVFDAQKATSAHPKESWGQASINKGAAPGGQSTAQGNRPSKRTDQHWPLKQSLKASTAANPGSKYSGSLAQPCSSTTPTENTQSQTAQTARFGADPVSAGLVGSGLPAQGHTPSAHGESPACSMLLVAGSHLRRWLSIVKMVSTYITRQLVCNTWLLMN